VAEPSAAISLDTGSVRITERFLADGVTPEAEAAARAEVRGLLDEAERVVDLSAPGRLVGLAGTITTVTAHALDLQAFDPQALNGAELSPQAVLASCEAIVHSTPEQRASWGYLAPGRRDVIAAVENGAADASVQAGAVAAGSKQTDLHGWLLMSAHFRCCARVYITMTSTNSARECSPVGRSFSWSLF